MSAEPLPQPPAPPALHMGCIYGEPIGQYHAAPAVSVSKLKVFRHSPALYQGRFITKAIPPPKETPAFFDGKAIESLALDGRAAFNATYCSVPADAPARPTKQMLEAAKPSAASLERQAYWRDFDERNKGKIPLDAERLEMVERINENLHAHHIAGPLLAACKMQVTFRIAGEFFPFQVRPDGWAEDGCELTKGEPFILDLKTLPALPDDEPETISRQISDYWYHGQEWAYQEIVADVLKFKDFRPRFFFVFVEKQEPFAVDVVELDDVSVELGGRQVMDTIERLKTAYRTNTWPNKWADTHIKAPRKISLPQYYIRRELGETQIF